MRPRIADAVDKRQYPGDSRPALIPINTLQDFSCCLSSTGCAMTYNKPPNSTTLSIYPADRTTPSQSFTTSLHVYFAEYTTMETAGEVSPTHCFLCLLPLVNGWCCGSECKYLLQDPLISASRVSAFEVDWGQLRTIPGLMNIRRGKVSFN